MNAWIASLHRRWTLPWSFGRQSLFVCCFGVLLWTMGCMGEATKPPPDRPTPRRSPPVVQESPTKHTFALKDESRKTPGSPDAPEKPQRDIKMHVWLGTMTAEQAGTFPLLIMAHGLGGSIDRFNAIATYIAAQGIAVAAPAFPLTHEAPGRKPAAGISDLAEQPGDVRFALDWLLKAVEDSSSPLYQRFDPKQIVGLGHSFGGATMLGLTRYECCQDKRLVASILVAPSTQVNALAFKAPKPAADGPPTLLIHGEMDETLQYSGSIALYDHFSPAKYFVGLPDASHSDLLESQTEPPIPVRDVTQRLIVAFVKAFTSGQPDDFAAMLAGLDDTKYEVKFHSP